MKTYQDLLSAGNSDKERGSFCRSAVNAFMSSRSYRDAKEGEAYYHRHNTTIEAYRKYLYTVSGNRVEDIFSSNYRLKTLFFRRLVTQQVQYVLGNGLTLSETEHKEALGKDFDFKLQTAAKRAMAAGTAFGFWNVDHMEVFGYADTDHDAGFCPLYDENTSQLSAGIRYWFRQVGKNVLFRCTLFEADGYTEFNQIDGDDVKVLQSKRGYKQIISKTNDGYVDSVTDENYGVLPIVPLYANDSHESELIGIRESIDCYDFVKSGLANDIDDLSGFYWVLKNTGGMEDSDLAQFIQRMKTVKATVVDGDNGVDAQAHTIDVPVQARTAMLELLRKDIYEDFQALDVTTLSAAAKTTQEIQAAYQSQDNKCADFEFYIIDFVQKILALAGIDDNPTFTWNRVVNQLEQTNMILAASEYLDQETILNKLPFLTPEEVANVLAKKDEEDIERFSVDEDDGGEPEELDDEDGDDGVDAELDGLLKELEAM